MRAEFFKGLTAIEDIDFKNKKVFLRLDLNVPIKDGRVTDDTRIRAAVETINYLREKGAILTLASHLGRPKSPQDVQFTLEPVAKRLSEILSLEVILLDNPQGKGLKGLFPGMRPNQIFLLENLRFDPREEKNDQELALEWAEVFEIYVNDAFGASHRAHASIDALPRVMNTKCLGFLMFKEVDKLSQLLVNPKKPYIAIMGGSKVSDKIDLIENMIDRVDGFIIGGAMAYTFLASQGFDVGASRVEKDKVKYAGELIERMKARKKSVHLPVDHVVASGFQSQENSVTSHESIADGLMGLDIGPKTRALYRDVISRAQTIFWNGPMGVFEVKPYDVGTMTIAKAIAENEKALTVVGGGDSAAAAQQSGFAEKFSHISTGGGASLEFLQGIKLPGVEAARKGRIYVDPKSIR